MEPASSVVHWRCDFTKKKLSSHLIGVDNDEKHAEKAIAMELVDEILPLDEAIRRSEVIILAIPVDALSGNCPGYWIESMVRLSSILDRPSNNSLSLLRTIAIGADMLPLTLCGEQNTVGLNPL